MSFKDLKVVGSSGMPALTEDNFPLQLYGILDLTDKYVAEVMHHYNLSYDSIKVDGYTFSGFHMNSVSDAKNLGKWISAFCDTIPDDDFIMFGVWPRLLEIQEYIKSLNS